MTIQAIKQETKNLDKRTEILYTYENVGPVYDGALNPDRYFFNSGPRILWLMKEAYDESDGQGFDLRESFKNGSKKYLNDFVFSRSKATWQPVTYVSNSLLNGFKSWEEIPYVRDDESVAECLCDIAWVNLNKSPKLDGKISDMRRLENDFRHPDIRQLILDQLTFLKPDLIICGNVFHLINEALPAPQKTHKTTNTEYYFAGGFNFINAYHPAQQRIPRKVWFEEIIQTAKQIPEF